MRGELTMLRALDSLRAEHQRALEREAEQTDQWIKEIKERHATERTQLLRRIAELEGDKVGGRVSDSTWEPRGGAEPGGQLQLLQKHTPLPYE